MKATINTSIPRVKKDILKKLKNVPTTIISDCLNRMNTMFAYIKPLRVPVRIAGQAITVQAMVGCNIASHKAIYIARKGDILCIDARGHVDTSVWGGVQTIAAKKRGITGVIVDGSVRDAAEIRKLRLPVFCKGISPVGPHKGWPDNINVPIACAGVPVIPGDIVVGDEDGVVVIPRERVYEVMKNVTKTLKKERLWIEKIKKGLPTTSILGLDKKYEEMQKC